MTLLAVLKRIRLDVSVKSVLAKLRNFVPRVFFSGFAYCHQSVIGKFPKAVASIPTGKLCVVRDVAGSKSKIAVKHAKYGQVCCLHPADLTVHNCIMERNSLYLTGLCSVSHGGALHTLRYCELDISSWGSDMQVDHAPGSQRVNNEKKPGLPHHRKPGAWSHVRMYNYNLNRLKLGGTNAAQTPSQRPHRASLPGNIGASARKTATNQSTRQTAGGGRYGTV